MKLTFGFFLKKPDREEFYNVGIHNENMDKIDEALGVLEANKATKTDLGATNTRVTNLENGKATKNGSSTENFSANNITANEATINGGTVYHTGRKPSKTDVGLGSVDNYPSSNLYTTLDGTGAKFVLQSAIKSFYDTFVALVTRVTNVESRATTLEGGKAALNGDSTKDFSAKNITATEATVNGGTVYHTGRKPSKTDVGLGSVDNTADVNKNVLSATKLTTTRYINGVGFDGAGNIVLGDLQGSNYIGGGSEKPNYFGAGKFRYQMLSGSNIGGGGDWKDVLWVSAYSGGDVKLSNALVFGKGSASLGFVQQNYDATAWGTYNKIYHSGDKPTKGEVGLDQVDNYPSSAAYSVLDGDGNKFVLQKAIKSFYDSFVALVTRVTNVESGKAALNGDSTKDFAAKNLTGTEATINGGTVYHTGRKPSKTDVGLGSVDNYPSSNMYNVLDGTGDKFILQKTVKAMFDKFVADIENVSVIGEPILTLCDTLPNPTDFGWMDGGQLKKTDYPKLWARVEATVNLAVQKVTAGTLQYGVTYFGWYIGDTSEYFRKPNMNGTGYMIRPSSSRFVGEYQVDQNKTHSHTASSASGGSHSHTASSTSAGEHVHRMWGETEGTAGGGQTMSYRSKSIANNLAMDTAGAHSHSITVDSGGGHAHTITVSENGGSEVTMKNIAGKYYCRLK